MKKIEKLKNIGKSCPGVYALVNHSKQKCYIGQTKNLKDRIACHVNTLDAGKHHSKKSKKWAFLLYFFEIVVSSN